MKAIRALPAFVVFEAASTSTSWDSSSSAAAAGEQGKHEQWQEAAHLAVP